MDNSQRTAEHPVTRPQARVVKPCDYCGEPFSAREYWPHRARCPKNPKLTRVTVKRVYTGPTIKCRYCSEEIFTKAFQGHFRSTPGHPKLSSEEGVCTVCQGVKPGSEFGSHARNGVPGPSRKCLSCNKLIANEWYAKNKERRKYAVVRKMYGLSREDYDAMFLKQDGKCAVCHLPPRGKDIRTDGLVVDHNHATGKARGLLCSGCNVAIGAFGEDLAVLAAAADYLRRHKD